MSPSLRFFGCCEKWAHRVFCKAAFLGRKTVRSGAFQTDPWYGAGAAITSEGMHGEMSPVPVSLPEDALAVGPRQRYRQPLICDGSHAPGRREQRQPSGCKLNREVILPG